MRRLYRAPRRRAAAFMRHPGSRRRGPCDHHNRRTNSRRQPSGAARLGRAGRGPVRLLPVRTNHVGRGPARREFLKTSALISGGLVIAFVVPGAKRLAVAQPLRAGWPFAPNAFLRVGSDDSVTVLLAHSEMGQGIWTGLSMLIAEELDADWSKIKVEHAEAAPVYAHTAFGMQMTGGSTSTWSEFDRYRQAGATARALLVQAAAQRFEVKPADCRTENGVVIAGHRRPRPVRRD